MLYYIRDEECDAFIYYMDRESIITFLYIIQEIANRNLYDIDVLIYMISILYILEIMRVKNIILEIIHA